MNSPRCQLRQRTNESENRFELYHSLLMFPIFWQIFLLKGNEFTTSYLSSALLRWSISVSSLKELGDIPYLHFITQYHWVYIIYLSLYSSSMTILIFQWSGKYFGRERLCSSHWIVSRYPLHDIGRSKEPLSIYLT